MLNRAGAPDGMAGHGQSGAPFPQTRCPVRGRVAAEGGPQQVFGGACGACYKSQGGLGFGQRKHKSLGSRRAADLSNTRGSKFRRDFVETPRRMTPESPGTAPPAGSRLFRCPQMPRREASFWRPPTRPSSMLCVWPLRTRAVRRDAARGANTDSRAAPTRAQPDPRIRPRSSRGLRALPRPAVGGTEIAPKHSRMDTARIPTPQKPLAAPTRVSVVASAVATLSGRSGAWGTHTGCGASRGLPRVRALRRVNSELGAGMVTPGWTHARACTHRVHKEAANIKWSQHTCWAGIGGGWNTVLGKRCGRPRRRTAVFSLLPAPLPSPRRGGTAV